MSNLPHLLVQADLQKNIVITPLKRWVRMNEPNLPANFQTQGTSHQLRKRLHYIGYKISEMTNAVYIIQPDTDGLINYAEDYINSDESIDQDNETEISNDLAFSLEQQMQEILRKNINQLEKGLIILDAGKEYVTIAGGEIDILAMDEEKNIVVIELKAGEAKNSVICQILAYMESIKSEKKCAVRGIIVANSFNNNILLASRQVPGLKLVEYGYQFSFKLAE